MKYTALISAFVAVSLILVIAGCGGGGGGGGTTLTGRVVNGATDAPLQGARVALGSASTTTAADGTFTLTGVLVGSGVLSVQLTGYEVATVSVTIVAGSNTLQEDVPMAPTTGNPPGDTPRTIQGTITLTGGSNPTGVTVTLLSGTTQIDQMTTAADGKYFFWAPVGTYKVRAAKTGFTTKEQQVTVTDLTKVVTVNITL